MARKVKTMPKIEPARTWEALEKRLESEGDPRLRQQLIEVIYHSQVEMMGDTEAALRRLAPEPVYLTFESGKAARVMRGIDEIRSGFYGPESRDEMHHRTFEYDIHNLVLDHGFLVTDGTTKLGIRGSWLARAGFDVEDDRDALYLRETRNCCFWSFDDDVRLIGEEIFYGANTPLEEVVNHRLAPDDVGTYAGPVIEIAPI
jgi:hypothetical protein